MMEITKEDLRKQIVKAIKHCHWRKDLGGVSICSFACLPCERTIDNGKCEVLIKMFKGNQKEEQESKDGNETFTCKTV